MALFLSEINEKIKEELKHRMDYKKRDDKGIYTRSTWMRMWSSADPKTMICGGLLDGEKTRSGFDNIYSPKSEDGNSYRPIAGITNLSCNYVGEYGSTRSATIKWVCWSFEDLEKLTPLFMTHGKTVVIEFGWSTGDKAQVTGIDPKSICDVWKSSGIVREKVIDAKGNFDAMIGLVKGWNWSIRDDGGIDCTTDIVAHGSNALDKSISPADDQKDGDRQTMMGFVDNLYQILEDEYGKEWTGKDGAASKFNSNENAWVSWGFIEDEIISKHLSIESKGAKLPVMKSVSYDDEGKNPKPSLVYYPKAIDTTKGDIIDVKAGKPFSSFKNEENNGAPLRNLAIFVEVVKTAFAEATTLQDVLENLFNEINKGACNIWDFRVVQHEEKPGEFGVIDSNWTKNTAKDMKDKAFVFPTWQRDSIVRDQTMDASLPDAQAITVMYGANNPKDDKADDEDISFQEGAKVLAEESPKDKCLDGGKKAPDAGEIKQDNDSGIEVSTTDPEQQKNKGLKNERKPKEESTKTKPSSETKDICAKVRKNFKKDISMLYPISLELTVDGIAGIEWGNAVHTAFIPKVYKDKVVFQVTAVNHTLGPEDWETVIQTVCRIAT